MKILISQLLYISIRIGHHYIRFVENGSRAQKVSSISKPAKRKQVRRRNQKRRSDLPSNPSLDQQKSEPPRKKRKPIESGSKSQDNPSPQKATKQKEPKKRRKPLQSKTPQTPTLVRGKVFKLILKQSKRKPKLGSRRRPTSSIPSIPQPSSPDIQKNQGRKRRGREKTPELPEVSR